MQNVLMAIKKIKTVCRKTWQQSQKGTNISFGNNIIPNFTEELIAVRLLIYVFVSIYTLYIIRH